MIADHTLQPSSAAMTATTRKPHAIAGNSYVLDTVNVILKCSRHDPFLRALDDWFSSRSPVAEDEQMFQVFLLFHLYVSAHAYEAADLVIDVTAIASDRTLRRSVEERLSGYVRAPIDLSDVRTDFDQSIVAVRSARDFVDTINQFVKFIVGSCSTKESEDFVGALKDRSLEEWQAHEFFTRNSRSVQAAKIEGTLGQLEECRAARRAADDAACEQATRLAEAVAIRDALQCSAEALGGERDGLAAQLAEAVAAQDSLNQSAMVFAEE